MPSITLDLVPEVVNTFVGRGIPHSNQASDGRLFSRPLHPAGPSASHQDDSLEQAASVPRVQYDNARGLELLNPAGGVPLPPMLSAYTIDWISEC